MSGSSTDSEEFHDAEDMTSFEYGSSRRNRRSRGSSTQTLVEENDTASHSKSNESEFVFLQPQAFFKGKSAFNELRQKLQTDDDDVQVTNLTPPNSQTSSVEGVYAPSSRTSHPFKVIEMDSLSMQSANSIGRLGRMFNPNEIDPVFEDKKKAVSMSAISSSSQESTADSAKSTPQTQVPPLPVPTMKPPLPPYIPQQPFSSSYQPYEQQETSTSYLPLNPPTTSSSTAAIQPQVTLQEPDVIASAKLSVQTNSGACAGGTVEVPVAPPRRRRTKAVAPQPRELLRETERRTPHYQQPASLPLQRPAQLSLTNPVTVELSKPTHSSSTLPNQQNPWRRQSSTHSLSSTDTLDINNPPSSKSITMKQQATVSSLSSHSLSSSDTLDIRQIIAGGQFVVRPADVDKQRMDSTDREVTPTTSSSGGSSLGKRGTVSGCGIEGGARKETAAATGHHPVTRGSVGQYSLGSNRTNQRDNPRPSRLSPERRRSAGDENMLFTLLGNTASANATAHQQQTQRSHGAGKGFISDYEILQKVTVLNLDTGEQVPLSVAEEKLPQCINPLSLHIMRLTSEYISSNNIDKNKDSDDESVRTKTSDPAPGDLDADDIDEVEDGEGDARTLRKKTARIKHLIGNTVKRTMHKARSIAQEVSQARHKEDIDLVDEVHPGESNIKLKASNSHKGPYDFENIQHVQELKDHDGPIWCTKFSCCGRLLATAGQDKILRIWVLKDAVKTFQDMRRKYNADKVSPTPSQESLASHHSYTDTFNRPIPTTHAEPDQSASTATSPNNNTGNTNPLQLDKSVFMPEPFCTYSGHTSDIMDVSWSKNYFILSSSMDKTVRLWHISRKECLCCFQHIDFVTAIVFHPRDDRYFLSGSLDGKLRLWNIPDKKVAVWNEIEDGNSKLITAANFCQNGKFAVVGSYDGRCIFYHSDQLKYHTQIDVRSTRGKNATGRKISGIEPMPGEDKILVTSNDSRIRLYDLRDLNLSCKYKGYINVSSQIKGSFSHDGKYMICGSENRDIFIWKTSHDYSKFSSVRRDRNDFWEAIKAHNALVTCAIFAPNPEEIISTFDKTTDTETSKSKNEEDPMVQQRTKGCGGYVVISADFNGCIKIFINKTKPKHSSLPASALV